MLPKMETSRADPPLNPLETAVVNVTLHTAPQVPITLDLRKQGKPAEPSDNNDLFNRYLRLNKEVEYDNRITD